MSLFLSISTWEINMQREETLMNIFSVCWQCIDALLPRRVVLWPHSRTNIWTTMPIISWINKTIPEKISLWIQCVCCIHIFVFIYKCASIKKDRGLVSVDNQQGMHTVAYGSVTKKQNWTTDSFLRVRYLIDRKIEVLD
jgi:hypothetical protein